MSTKFSTVLPNFGKFPLKLSILLKEYVFRYLGIIKPGDEGTTSNIATSSMLWKNKYVLVWLVQ
jgi:hypothetical protein